MHRTTLRQERCYNLASRGGPHDKMIAYMASHGYNDNNRAYAVCVGSSNIKPNGDKYCRLSIPYPYAKNHRAIVVLPRDQIIESDAVSEFTKNKCYDVDLGDRTRKRKITYVDMNGNRKEDYVSALRIERYMNFSDWAYLDGTRRVKDYLYKCHNYDKLCERNVAVSFVAMCNTQNFIPSPELISTYYTKENGWDKTAILRDIKDSSKVIAECFSADEDFITRPQSMNAHTYEIYRDAMVKGAVDVTLFSTLKHMNNVFDDRHYEINHWSPVWNLYMLVNEPLTYFKDFYRRFDGDIFITDQYDKFLRTAAEFGVTKADLDPDKSEMSSSDASGTTKLLPSVDREALPFADDEVLPFVDEDELSFL